MARTQEIRVRFRKEEKEKIKRKAEAAGLDPSVYLRVAGLVTILKMEHINPLYH